MKSCTDIPQSKKLAEILPIKSADMYYWCGEDLRRGNYKAMDTEFDIPCWSLAALLELIPKNYLIEVNKKTTRTLYHITAISGEVTHYHQDLVDAAVELLLKLYNKNIHEHRTD